MLDKYTGKNKNKIISAVIISNFLLSLIITKFLVIARPQEGVKEIETFICISAIINLFIIITKNIYFQFFYHCVTINIEN